MKIEIFLLPSCNFALLLVNAVFVDCAEVTLSKVKVLLSVIDSTIWVSVLPLSLINETESPILNSSLNLVPNPVTLSDEAPTLIVPLINKFSPLVESKAVSAVYVGVPAIPICLTLGKSNSLTPFIPKESLWIAAVLPDVPPVIVSPALNWPTTLDTTTIPCLTTPPEEYEVMLTASVPFEAYTSKLFVVTFLAVNIVESVIADESTWKPAFSTVNWWPSLKPCPFAVTVEVTPGLSVFVIDVIATLVVVEIDSTIPFAFEVPPVIVSPVVNAWSVVIFKCWNILISNK